MSKNENLLPVLRKPQLKKIQRLAPKLLKAQKKKKKDTNSIHQRDSRNKCKKLFPKAINPWQISKKRVCNSGSQRQRGAFVFTSHIRHQAFNFNSHYVSSKSSFSLPKICLHFPNFTYRLPKVNLPHFKSSPSKGQEALRAMC